VCSMLLIAAIAAAWHPAFRASRLDPAETLRAQ
jgi:ABC-type lipoprotein release transport system permease subunit